LLAIDKPAAIAVHGGPLDHAATVASWFAACYPREAAAFEAERPGVVHRLDKDTTGVLLLAKTPAAQAALSRVFAERSTRKSYLAVTDGIPSRERAIIDAPIGRHPADRTRMAIVTQGRAARTEYEVLARDAGRAFVLVRPESGRTHQVRVHLASIGAPVAGDGVYGRRSASRQLLHAWRIELPHPEGGHLEVTAPLPPDIVRAVDAIAGPAVALPYSVTVPAERTAEPE
jgi:23S rRNA pseudouridine1911/1915/1917 synthase